MVFLWILISLIVALGIVLLVARGLGPPVSGLKFDETPADVFRLDSSDGVPIENVNIQLDQDRPPSEEEQKQYAASLEQLRLYMQAERR